MLIIAILIAIAIPIFTSQLNAARVATDEANARSGYAVATATVLTEGTKVDTTWSLNSDGTLASGTAGSYTTSGKQETATVIGSTSGLTWEPGQKVVYTYSAADGKVTISFAATS